MVRATLSVIKADVGSIGGHTLPSRPMVDLVRARLADAIASDLVVDGTVTFTGDDIAIVMSRTRGAGAADIHGFAWDSFLAATAITRESGLHGPSTPPSRAPTACP